MAANPYILEAPNVCAFGVNQVANKLGFFVDDLGVVTYYGSSITDVLSFTNREDALSAARSIDPTCSKNYIYGPAPLTLTKNFEDNLEVTEGQTVTFECTGVCDADPQAVITYKWIVGAVETSDTGSSFTHTFNRIDGGLIDIRCQVEVQAADNWTNKLSAVCLVEIF